MFIAAIYNVFLSLCVAFWFSTRIDLKISDIINSILIIGVKLNLRVSAYRLRHHQHATP